MISYYIIRRSNYIPPAYSAGYLNYRCSTDDECESLSCDDVLKVCKVAVGSECSTKYDCNSESYCSGICVPYTTQPTAESGILNGYCPCFFDNQSCVNGICKSTTVCQFNSDCVTGLCNSGVCSPLFENGNYCQNNQQCYSGNCSNGICQQINVRSGTLGSACVEQSQCNNELTCTNGFCVV